MSKSLEEQIIVKVEKDFNDFYLYIKKNLDNQILEINDKKFLGNISGNKIEV